VGGHPDLTDLDCRRKGETKMAKRKDPDREERILMEIVVDAYGEEERAMGWYYYLQDNLQFPFPAKCASERPISLLGIGDQVSAIDMPPEDECMREMFVTIEWDKRKLAVPLAQLQALKADKETLQAVEDWHYWAGMGYEF